MAEIFLGAAFIVLLFVFIYILGIAPNLWSNDQIHYLSMEDVMLRGLYNFVMILFMFIGFMLLWVFGSVINEII